ncbi:MAG: TetR/AcrR family transcriptional regulator [Eubacteriales bacterium]|nr:TetR/AcrR family transcriptional regulator [Eubacteriales bacterium]
MTKTTDKSIKCDRRVIKTKRAIKSAFIKLLSEKNMNNITIKEIADLADVDRKTIYNYYRGTYMIMEEIEAELVDSFMRVTDDLNFENLVNRPLRVFDTLSDVINDNIELYGELMKIDSSSQIVKKITQYLKEKIKQSLENVHLKDSRRTDFVSEYITTGLIAVYQSWFNSDRSYSLEKLSSDVGTIVLYGMKELLK